MKTIIFGASGLLGQAIYAQAAIPMIAPTHAQLDVCDHAAVQQYLAQQRPVLVINCTAYSAVDAAEDAPEQAMALNHHAVDNLVQACDAVGASLVHFSTDFVFDGWVDSRHDGVTASTMDELAHAQQAAVHTSLGSSSYPNSPTARGLAHFSRSSPYPAPAPAPRATPYTKADTPRPLNVYGASKLAGEQAVLASVGAHYVFRVSWLYGATGSNFFSQVRDWLQQDRVLRIVADQVSVPNDVARLARAMNQWCQLAAAQPAQFLPQHRGLYHVTAAQAMSRYDFAQQVAAELGRQAIARLEPVPASAFSARAARPLYSAMSAQHFTRRFGIII
jgi:dTDP-4-dehydrorhamnose reductase